MAKFDISHKITSVNEGGYTDEHNDGGNWTGGRVGEGNLIGTNLGISAPVLCDFLRRTATTADMKSLPVETAHVIYRKNYWDKMRGDEIENQGIANSIYDSCVNMGCSRAIKLAQAALGINQSGKMDELTLKTLNNK